jgi:hypothetical protein
LTGMKVLSMPKPLRERTTAPGTTYGDIFAIHTRRPGPLYLDKCQVNWVVVANV